MKALCPRRRAAAKRETDLEARPQGVRAREGEERGGGELFRVDSRERV